MPNNNLKQYYSYLKSNGADVAPTYESFVSTLSNESNAKKYHSYLVSNGFDAPKTYESFAQTLGLKKKEDSQSTLDQDNTSSDRLNKTTTKPTVSSSLKGDGIYIIEGAKEGIFYKKSGKDWYRKVYGVSDYTKVTDPNRIKNIEAWTKPYNVQPKKQANSEILTGYPSNKDKKYKFEDNQWYEQKTEKATPNSVPSKFGGTSRQYEQPKLNLKAGTGGWKPIEDPNRVKNLNSYFNKEGSVSLEEKVFTNYDEQKKDNLYRIKNGQWERKVPKGTWAPVNDETATIALNKRYGQNVVFKEIPKTEINKEDTKFADINSNLTAKTEEDAINYLRKNYSKYGFDFNEEGLFAIDQIRVKTKDGKKEEVFEFDESNPAEAARLRAFLEENKSKQYSNTYRYLESKVYDAKSFLTDKGIAKAEEAHDRTANYLLSDDYYKNFINLTQDEMKDQISQVVLKSGIDSKSLQKFYQSKAYKAYQAKKIEANKLEQNKLDGYYDELKYAKLSGNKSAVQTAQNKINAYLTNDVISDNVKNYDMQLNDIKNRNKQLEVEYKDYQKQVGLLNTNKKNIEDQLKTGQISREQYNSMIGDLNKRADQLNTLSETIETKAEKIKLDADSISTSQKKLNYIAGKYIAAKEKEGSAIGFTINSILNGVSSAFVQPFASLAASGSNKYERLSPEEKQYYKDKGYTKEQTENILDNEAILKDKNFAKEYFVKNFGFEDTTPEYMQSKDRGFLATAIGGTLQSLPAMATAYIGNVASFSALAAQAYSGIEEEMLKDPDFKTTSVAERSMITIPYAVGMGVLENFGLSNMFKSTSATGRAFQGLITRTIEKAPKGATQDFLNKLVAKEVESNILKGTIKITQAGLAEFETGALQSLVLDQGLKQVYNVIAQRGMTNEEKKNLSQGEFFDTADTFSELASQTFDDAVSEMIGGVTLGAVGTLSQKIVNGNVSIYNEDDVEFLKNVAQDNDFKKLFVTHLKTSMLNGSMTKGQAQDKLDALNEVEATLNKLPENTPKEYLKQSMDLVVEKTKLEKEIAGKDPALVAAQTERINAINEELKTISQNAVQKPSTESEVSRPGETGQTITEGGEGVGQSVQGESVTEEGKSKEEVDKRISELEGLISSDNASIQETGKGNLIPEARQAITEELQTLKESKSVAPKVEIGGITRGYETISGNEAVGDIRSELPNQSQGTVVLEGKDGNQYAVAFSRKGADGKNIFEQGTTTPRPGYISASVKIDENATPEQIQAAQQEAQRNLETILPAVVNGSIDSKAVNDILAQQPVAQPSGKTGELPATAQINVAPLFDTKVSNIQEAEAIRQSDVYKQYKQKIEMTANDFGVTVNNIDDSIGGYAGVSEVSNVVNVTGDWNNVVEFAAVFGAMTPEVQDSTIAGRAVEANTEEHNADRFDIGIDNQEAAMKAASDAGFDQDGFTLSGDKISFFNIFEYPVEDFENKYVTFVDKYLEYGGQITSETKSAIQSEFIDSDRRAEIIAKIEGNAVQQAGREGVRNAIQEAKPRNEEYIRRKTPQVETEQQVVAEPSNENELTDRNVRTMSVKYKRNPIVKAASNVLKALPGVKIYLHENTDQYSEALANKTGENKQSIEKESSAGSYIDGEIHLDMSKADTVTLLHEAIHHALMVNGVKGKYIIDMAKGLRDIIKDKERLAELDNFISAYGGETDQETLETRADEFVAQLGGILAANQEELTTTGLTKFKALINRIFKKLGLGNVFTAASTSQDAVNFINAITRGLNVGEDVSGKYDPKTGKLKFQADFSDPLSRLTFVYDKNNKDFKQLEKDGYITYDKSLSDFAGKYMFLHQPDAAFSGMIYKNGELLVEGKGGVYYPIKFHKDGYFWASTSNTAKKMAEDLNKVLEQNRGTIYMALTSAPYDKLMSSTTMANAILDFFSSKAFDKNFKINQAQLKKALVSASNDVQHVRTVNQKTGNVSIKNVGLNLGLKSSMSIDEMQSLIRTKLNPDNSSFGDRKNFASVLIRLMSDNIKNNPEAVQQFGKLFSEGIQNKYFKGVTKTGKLSISAANMSQAVSEMFTEPLLKEGVDREKGGQVYAVIELNGPVKPVDSDKHESYPKAIQSASDAKVKMHILTDRQKWNESFEDFENNSDIVKSREKKIFPSSGVSVRGLKVKGSLGRKKQLVYHGGDVINESDLREGDPLYVSKDKKQAELYAEGNQGNVTEFDIDETKLADEKIAFDIINELGLKSTEGWNPSELNLFELIDPRFETSMSQSDINKLFEEVTNRGYDGIKFMDTNIDTLKQDIENYVIINPKKTIFGKEKRKQQKAPKILGQKPTQVIVKDEAKALIGQIKLEVRAQREQKKAQTEVRKSISDSVKEMVKKGSINLKQASTIISTLNRVNLDNPEMVKRFNDYIAKVFDKAEYIDKVERATKIKKKIKQNLKGAANPFAIAAKGFSQLDPKWVENIDDYIAVAQAVYDSVRKSTVRKGVINWKQEADFQEIAQYVFDEEARQTEMLLGNLKSLYERITGKSSDGIAADVMQAELKDMSTPEDFDADVLDQIEEKLAEFEGMVEDTDPEVVQKAASIDPSIIPTKEAIRILDALDTYFMNGSTAGLNELMDIYNGKENAIKFKYKAKPLRALGSKKLAQTKFQNITQFNMILERKFRSKEAALAYKKASGIQDIENGANKAEKQAMTKQREYVSKFGKVKGFNSAENIFERGALANLMRTMVASEDIQQQEFDRNIDILRNSVDTLSKGNSNDVKKAAVYKKVLTKLGVFNSNVDLEMVLKNAKKENIDAVNFVIDMFGEIVDPLSDLALGMYNQVLTQDVNYTPYVYKMTELAGNSSSKEYGADKDGNPNLNFFGTSTYANQTFDKNKAGVLMPITRPKNLRKGMHIDLDFDNNMFRQYRNALVDIYTAGPIRRLDGFFNSEQNNKILDSNEDKQIIYSAMVDYIRTKKGSNFVTDDGLKFLNKISDYMAQFGAARALVGLGQFVNQFSSGMSNTIVNAGEYIRPGDFSKDIFDFIARSGRSIANVGGDEVLIAMGDVDKSIERADLDSKYRVDQTLLKFIAKENMRLFNVLVAYPDAVARKLAWMAYYRKSLVEQGLLGFTEAIDTTKPINDQAADYAQLMVDRNMDSTDAALRGSLFRNRNASVKILRSIFMPFASFGINQKNRMWNDLNALFSGSDIATSFRSLASIAGELVVYNAIRYYIAKTILGAALSLLGYDDDDQEELYNKLLTNAKLSSFSKLFTDIVSPLPMMDNQTLKLANKALKGSSLFQADPEAVNKYVEQLKAKGNLTDEEIEAKKKAFEEKNAKSFYVDTEANIGTLGIQYDKAIELLDLVNAWKNGEYTDDYGNERFLSKESRDKLTAPLMLKFAATVYGTRELDQIANKSFKLVKDAESMSSEQKKSYDEVKKELGRDLTEFERSIVKKKKNPETALGEIEYLNSKGKFTKDQGSEYIKLLEIIPTPSDQMIIDIQNGKKADDIIKKNKG